MKRGKRSAHTLVHSDANDCGIRPSLHTLGT